MSRGFTPAAIMGMVDRAPLTPLAQAFLRGFWASVLCNSAEILTVESDPFSDEPAGPDLVWDWECVSSLGAEALTWWQDWALRALLTQDLDILLYLCPEAAAYIGHRYVVCRCGLPFDQHYVPDPVCDSFREECEALGPLPVCVDQDGRVCMA